MSLSKPYSKKFFSERELGARSSAKTILPLLIDLVNPESVIDVGCGNGVWLDELSNWKVEKYLGIDGHWANNELLKIPREKFLEHDLASGMPEITATFDLAISIEVAEHLPEQSSDEFIAFLCGLAPVVAFSAAVPMQGGTGHYNEQPQSYWMEKFRRQSFICFDYMRPKIWSDDNANIVHRQNLLLYVSSSFNGLTRRLESYKVSQNSLVDVIHPELYRLRLSQAIRKRNLFFRLYRYLMPRVTGLANER